MKKSKRAVYKRQGLRSMLDAVENGRIEAVMVRDLEQISRNSYILVGVIAVSYTHLDVYKRQIDNCSIFSITKGFMQPSSSTSFRISSASIYLFSAINSLPKSTL